MRDGLLLPLWDLMLVYGRRGQSLTWGSMMSALEAQPHTIGVRDEAEVGLGSEGGNAGRYCAGEMGAPESERDGLWMEMMYYHWTSRLPGFRCV